MANGSCVVLSRVQLRNFRAFESFDLPVHKGLTIMLGPNNAGKTSAHSSLRAAAGMISHAKRRNPDRSFDVRGEDYRGYVIRDGMLDIETDNLRHGLDSRNETSLAFQFRNGTRLRAVWPPDSSSDPPFFYITRAGQGQPMRPADVRQVLPSVGIVPVLGPLSRREAVRDPKTIRAAVQTRLFSSHFRNHLLYMEDPDGFREFANSLLPDGLVLGDVVQSGDEIDLYYREGRHERELSWAGDGVQIFLQILFHLFRLRGTETIVLDEPDIFLHADLQRRLLRVLEAERVQAVLASHSSELVIESDPKAISWVDKSRKRAISSPADADLDAFSRTMGSGINLKLARVLRANLALFVEGEDVKILRRIARKLGLHRLETERGLAVVPLEGSSNRRKLEAFHWIADEFLDGAVTGMVLLDRDYRSGEATVEYAARLQEAGLVAHYWERHELESYLLEPALMARVAGTSTSEMLGILERATSSIRQDTYGQVLSARQEEGQWRGVDISVQHARCVAEVDSFWDPLPLRLHRIDPKRTLEIVNRNLGPSVKRISWGALAEAIKPAEIPDEMATILRSIENLAAGGG